MRQIEVAKNAIDAGIAMLSAAALRVRIQSPTYTARTRVVVRVMFATNHILRQDIPLSA